MTTAHDVLFKKVFEQPEHAASYLRFLLPAHLASTLDLEKLRYEKTSFIDPKLKQRHADLLLRVPRKDGTGDVFLYILLEHQSTEDRMMAFRVLIYTTRFWEWWWAQHPTAKQLPPILPIVLFHGERPWRAPKSLGSLIDLPPPMAPFRAWLPEQRFLLHDLSAMEDSDLRGQQLLQLTLLLFKYGRKRKLLDILEQFQQLLAPILRNRDGFTILMTYLHLVEPDLNEQRLEKLMTSFLDVDEPMPYRTIADAYREEGEAKGRLEGQRTLVRAALGRVASELPASALERVAQADEEQLQRWLLGLLDGASLADLGLAAE